MCVPLPITNNTTNSESDLCHIHKEDMLARRMRCKTIATSSTSNFKPLENSWYLTPPSSSEGPSMTCKTRLRKTSDSAVVCSRKTSVMDPDETPKRTQRGLYRKVDILKELYKKSMIGTVCVNILNRLSKKDLLRYDLFLLYLYSIWENTF